MSIFKAYDIRGKYPLELNELTAKRIASATAEFISGKKIAVGRDARTMAPSIAKAVIEGLNISGCDVWDIGLCTTPTLYFTVGHYELDGGIMVTASHNPHDYIGLKICREKAIPVGGDSGLETIKSMIDNEPQEQCRGNVEIKDVLSTYKQHVLSFLKNQRPLNILIDFSNGTVGPAFKRIFSETCFNFTFLCSEPDGRFPNHEPDPLKDENVRDLKSALLKRNYDLACAFDGDGDRVMFFEPDGKRIWGDTVTILLARSIGVKKETVIYDVRSGKALPEEIRVMGGNPVKERVGHAFIKKTMRALNAKLGGEFSAHYYFRDNYFADSGIIAFAAFASYLCSENIPLATITQGLRRYHHSGEINFTIKSKESAIESIRKEFHGAKEETLDGITIECGDFWFNLRPSNTEPFLRLTMEAHTQEKLLSSMEKIKKILERYV